MAYTKITLKTTINQDSKVRRIKNSHIEYYTIIAFDDNANNYVLKSSEGILEAAGVTITTTTQDLIDNFEILVLE